MLYEIRKLFLITGQGIRFVILLLLRCPFDALMTLVQATFLQHCFQAIVNNSQSELYIACIIFTIENGLLFLYNGTVWSSYAAFTARFISSLRNKVFQHVSGIPLRSMEEKPSGEWFTRLNSDIWQATAVVNQPMQLPHAAVATVNLLISAAILIRMNQIIFGLVILFLIPHMLISQWFIAKPMTKLAKRSQEVTAENSLNMNSLITCADTALLYDAQEFLLRSFEESSLKLRSTNMKMRIRSAAGTGLLPMMGMGGYLILLLVGSTWIMKGTMTFGELTAAFQYRGGVLKGSMMLMNCIVSMKSSLAGVQRVNGTLKLTLEE